MAVLEEELVFPGFHATIFNIPFWSWANFNVKEA